MTRHLRIARAVALALLASGCATTRGRDAPPPKSPAAEAVPVPPAESPGDTRAVDPAPPAASPTEQPAPAQPPAPAAPPPPEPKPAEPKPAEPKPRPPNADETRGPSRL